MKNNYFKALFIAKTVHKNQKDKSGKPYINHPLTVSRNVKELKAKIVALLHDVIEDGNITVDYLRKYFTEDICNAVETLTHKKTESYFEYINKIKQNKLATIVKIADLEHNMDIKRLGKLTKKDLERLAKYMKAYRLLTI